MLVLTEMSATPEILWDPDISKFTLILANLVGVNFFELF